MSDLLNGMDHQSHAPEGLKDYVIDVDPRLPAGPLRRLARLGASVEGATEVAQAAIAAHDQRRRAYQQAFEGACEDAGIKIPAGEHDVQIDWASGEVRFTPRL